MQKSLIERPFLDWGGNILALVMVLAVNTLANAVPLGGQTTGEISDKYPSLFTPAGYVFSIWGLIYLSLLLFIIWQALPTQRNNALLKSLQAPFQISCLCNAAWIFAWHYDHLILSFVIMSGLLWTLVHIYQRLNLNRNPRNLTEGVFLYLPFSLYTAWISVAVIANASAIQITCGWQDAVFSPTTWTLLKLAVAGTLAVAILFRFRDSVWMLVLVWASFGIAVKNPQVPIVHGAAMLLALLGIGLVIVQLVLRLGQMHRV